MLVCLSVCLSIDLDISLTVCMLSFLLFSAVFIQHHFLWRKVDRTRPSAEYIKQFQDTLSLSIRSVIQSSMRTPASTNPRYDQRCIVLKKKCVDAIKNEWTPDSRKITNVHKTYLTDHFVYKEVSAWTPSTSLTDDYTSGYDITQPVHNKTKNVGKIMAVVSAFFRVK